MLVIYLKDCNCIATILKVLIFYIAQRKCIYKAVKCALLRTVTVNAENTVARLLRLGILWSRALNITFSLIVHECFFFFRWNILVILMVTATIEGKDCVFVHLYTFYFVTSRGSQ